jgi:hypothetical protein
MKTVLVVMFWSGKAVRQLKEWYSEVEIWVQSWW